jgi:hypothetical protein
VRDVRPWRAVLVASPTLADRRKAGRVNFADMIAAQNAKQRRCDDVLIRAQARKRAERLDLDPDLMETHAAQARASLDPEPALQKAARLTRADMVFAGLTQQPGDFNDATHHQGR